MAENEGTWQPRLRKEQLEEGEKIIREHKGIAWGIAVKPVIPPEAEAQGLTAKDVESMDTGISVVHSINFTAGSAATSVRVLMLPDGWLEVVAYRDGKQVAAIDLDAEEGVKPLMEGDCDCPDCVARKARTGKC